ncbi:ATP-dependent DNA helicase [Stereum hirsutum FP-91666 SS1]|uniref:ATP-dependent DNA helicase n=1 Tax=Stereum hirsutum (strain FP-91666) TaxID=721885 RepID=UPI000444A6C9|nr:ATP-dependent DNA helicase [Stereum hirsutum FP-91666 SS1]EIM81881.1 ATP-dependent DNA helicase [Stereum hirsutum FP-91666 SS1]
MRDYREEFDWSPQLRLQLKKVFDISSFRLVQEPACNANIDGRDIVCIMPTGGGKSIVYQLPALFALGCTLVISPLLSLIKDQIMHLQEAGVEAVMLTGSTSKDDQSYIYKCLQFTADPNKVKGGSDPKGRKFKEIKLCYVTPEKVAKSKTLLAIIETLAERNRLPRIVIDEAHCVSQLGHDFRPDYKALSKLRQLFPNVPILALSATCPPNVLKDVLKILRLNRVTDFKQANADGTVYLTSPLYRKNLHYKVLPKPKSAKAFIEQIIQYIEEEHPGKTGIIYCLTQKDAEDVAKGVQEGSKGKVKCGVYHASIPEPQKEGLHEAWRAGKVKVVAATIAFGLGIDKADVRFVLHHSKSLENYYQESGRAGRDGDDAECVLFYRAQDAFRLTGVYTNEIGGVEKIHGMVQFAQDVLECRKIQFIRYFSSIEYVAVNSWTQDSKDSLTPCGHCDNCTRDPSTVENKDVTLDAWRVLQKMKALDGSKVKATMNELVEAARGLGGAGSKAKKVRVDSVSAVGGSGGVDKVEMSEKETEALVMTLVVRGYLKEAYVQTAYRTNIYLTTGPKAYPITRLSRTDIENGRGERINMGVLKEVKKKRKSRKSGTNASGKDVPTSSKTAKAGRGVKRKQIEMDGEDEGDEDEDIVDDADDEVQETPRTSRARRKENTNTRRPIGFDFEDPSDDEVEYVSGEDDWAYDMKGTGHQSKGRPSGGGSKKANHSRAGQSDVIEISSD